MITCGKCGKQKPRTEFGLRRNIKRGFDYYCKQCRSELAKKYRQDNKEHLLQTARERSARREHTSAIPLRGKCQFCGETRQTARHHLLPKEFGDHDKDNLIEVCRRCHGLAHAITTRILWRIALNKKKVV